MSAGAVQAYVDKLGSRDRATVDALRELIRDSHSGLTESIKWNAPSFALDGEDRITLNISPKGGVRVVLHRGAKAKSVVGFHFEDREGLAHWPAPDRGVITFSDAGEVSAKSDLLRPFFSRWIEATSTGVG